jgi:hypothetical protein
MTRPENDKNGCDQQVYGVVRGGIEPPTSRFSGVSGPSVRVRPSTFVQVSCLSRSGQVCVSAGSWQSDGGQGATG